MIARWIAGEAALFGLRREVEAPAFGSDLAVDDLASRRGDELCARVAFLTVLRLVLVLRLRLRKFFRLGACRGDDRAANDGHADSKHLAPSGSLIVLHRVDLACWLDGDCASRTFASADRRGCEYDSAVVATFTPCSVDARALDDSVVLTAITEWGQVLPFACRKRSARRVPRHAKGKT